VTGQRSADRESNLLVNEFLQPAFFSADQDAKQIRIASNLSKARASRLALTLPDTSLFIKMLRSLERKIDERLRCSARHIATNP
jgi:hypothetical protein